MLIIYVLSRPNNESDTMMLKANSEPSTIRLRRTTTTEVTYTALKGTFHLGSILLWKLENGRPERRQWSNGSGMRERAALPLSRANAKISLAQVASAVMLPI